MPQIPTKFFGDVDCNPDEIYSFPSGLPGFEEQHSFFFVTTPAVEPLMFLQSLTTRNLCFILLPILAVNPQFKLELTSEELSELGLAQDRKPVIGEDILCAAIVCSGNGESPTANMMAPVVVNLRAKIGMQLIHGESGYSHQHPLLLKEAIFSC
jgi:flagellar assembly factor FliW